MLWRRRHLNEWYWQCIPGGAPAPRAPAGPNNTLIMIISFPFPPGSITCSQVDASAAADVVLKRAQSLSATTGRSFELGGAPTCTDVPVPVDANGRQLLQAVLEVPISSVVPVTTAPNEAEALLVAKAAQTSVQGVLLQVVQAAVSARGPGRDPAAISQQMRTTLGQVKLNGKGLPMSPPLPVVEFLQPPSPNSSPATEPTTASPPPR